MDERRVADYFVVAGLPDNPQEISDVSQDPQLKSSHSLPPITDVCVIFTSLGEEVPADYTCIKTTPNGYSANLNTGAWRGAEIYLCYKRGSDKPPLVDIGVIYEGKERIMADSKIVRFTPYGRPANISSGNNSKTFVTIRRATVQMPCNQLVVTDICVIVPSKGEKSPHAFCLIDKSLNKSLIGVSGAYICYKKSMNRPPLIKYEPAVLRRYPEKNYCYFPFPEKVSMFCLPMGATIESWPSEADTPKPVFSTFVLTVSDASEKVYGSAITFYENFPLSGLNDRQKKILKIDSSNQNQVHVNKSICILSHWPFFDTFEKSLKFLYEMSCSGPHLVPIERYISYFLEDIPFPTSNRTRILVQLSATERLILNQPEDLPLPRSGSSFCHLLTNLGADNCMLVLLLVLTEQKILVHSLRPDVLTSVAEALSMIIFPFKWTCPYIPLCPLGLVDVMHAPLPYLIGFDSRFFELYEPPGDVSCIDLDTNCISICEEKRQYLNSKILPKKPARALKTSLSKLLAKVRSQSNAFQSNTGQDMDSIIDREFTVKRREQKLEVEIQEAFLHFMASVLKGYRHYLLPITKAPTAGATDSCSLFNLDAFLRSREKGHQKFFSLIIKTQMFTRFIEERSFVSDMDTSLAFFDECTEKVDTVDEYDTPFIEFDESQSSERTLYIMAPEPTGLPQGVTYSYKGFILNPVLFSEKELPNFLDPRISSISKSSNFPGSPVAKRTKYEVRSAQKKAREFSSSHVKWAKCLLGTCYSIWFIHLPSYVMQSDEKSRSLHIAYDLLEKINEKIKIEMTDEVCYRVVMQLCGLYSLPVLAVKLLFLMKRSHIQLNAITYGFYNRAVLEAAWPAEMKNPNMLWKKLRNVIIATSLFRISSQKGARRKLSLISDDETTEKINKPIESLITAEKVEKTESSNPIPILDVDQSDTEANDTIIFGRQRSSTIVKGSPQAVDSENVDDKSLHPRPRINDFQNRHRHTSSGKTDVSRLTAKHATDSNECFRVLRSESFANDAQIVEKLNKLTTVETTETKPEITGEQKLEHKQVANFKIRRSPQSPVRMTVTENDPLGALNMDFDVPESPKKVETPPVESSPIKKLIDTDEDPVLFRESNRHRRAKTEEEARSFHAPVMRSATYHQGLGLKDGVTDSGSEGDNDYNKKIIQKSSTLPMSSATALIHNVVTSSPVVASSLSSLSSSLKLPFSAMSGKRSNELFANFKHAASSAATSVVKKIDEIKEVISANATPIKSNSLLGSGDVHDSEATEDSEYEKRTHITHISPTGSYRNIAENWNFLEYFTAGDVMGSRKGSASNLHSSGTGDNSNWSLHKILPENLYESNVDENNGQIIVSLEVDITSSSRCHNCANIMYDEEIMAGWVPDDSNLNTKCQYCGQWIVPLLTISILDYREHAVKKIKTARSMQELKRRCSFKENFLKVPTRTRSKSESQLDQTIDIEVEDTVVTSDEDENSKPVPLETISVPYLNPLVLRKEVENILDNEGDVALTKSQFVDDHPIIYWNMVWIFKRIDVNSHLMNLMLNANTINKNRNFHSSWDNVITKVVIRCLWENSAFHEELGVPMYILWQQMQNNLEITDKFSLTTMEQVIDGIKSSELLEPLQKCLLERENLKNKGIIRRYSIYRDILFLALFALGSKNIDTLAFDEEYKISFEKLNTKDNLFEKCDHPLSNYATCCRYFFKQPNLL